jgi:signal transduction histidine kinase
MRIRDRLRPRRLVWRIATMYLAVGLAILAALGSAIYYTTSVYLARDLQRDLSSQAGFYAAYAATLADDEAGIAEVAPDLATLFAPQTGINVRVFAASNGALLASTQEVGSVPSTSAHLELGHRGRGPLPATARDAPDRGYAAAKVHGRSGAIAVIEVSRMTTEIDAFLASLRTIILSALGLATAALSVASIGAARRLAAPVARMEDATRRIAEGDYEAQVDVRTEDEIGRLARSVNRLALRLQELEAARMDFISEISHDLRTPLTAMKGLLANLVDASDESMRPALELAEREGDRLIRLVNQLLDFARWRGGRLRIERRPVDVARLVSDAVGLCQEAARHRRVALSLVLPSADVLVSGDADRLERVVLNLLDNAVKFTPPGGRVDASVQATPGGVEFAVSDNGQGMTQCELSRAFEPYVSGGSGGAGLGLAISRAIVEAHGGSMGIDSERGRGTRAWFTLPV